jgi:4-hydroxythreonine-4-phosphate dehydrogenase
MNPITKSKPIIGISMGDPSGVGPEVIIKHTIYESTTKDRIVVFGSKDVFEYYLELFNIAMPINEIESVDSIKDEYHDGELNIIKYDFDIKKLKVGKLDRYAGECAFECASNAIDATIAGKIDAVVTAPFNKEAINLAGFDYIGHTELLATKTKTRDYVMMLASKRFRVALVTTHVALKDVPKLIKKDRILKTIEIVNKDLKKWFGIEKPKIAVSALNPHNSEGGLMGSEEKNEIMPAIEAAKKQGINVEGSFAADTLFIKEKRSDYDCFIAMYHDQGLVPLKALYFDSSVNITLGIPIIRTSPDHGTAFDIAGKFKANHKSLTEAIRQAHRMARWKQKNH